MNARNDLHTQRLLRRLAAAGFVLVALVVAASAYLRLGAAGLGCADWPACYGAALAGGAEAGRIWPGLPQDALPDWARLAHRLAAVAVGAIVLALVWLARGEGRAAGVARAAWGALLLTLFLAGLGRFTPAAQWPAVTLGNLLAGFALLALLAWLAWPEHERPAPAARALRPMLLAGLALLALQVALGALVSGKFAALACGGFPGCGAPVPPQWEIAAFDPFVTLAAPAAAGTGAALQLAHRAAALALLACFGWLALRLYRCGGRRAALGAALGALALLEAALGAAAVLAELPLALAVAHNLGAALLAALLACALRATGPGGASGNV